MAFQDVKQSGPRATGEPVKLTKIDVGDEVVGYLVKLVPSKQNPDTMNFLMQAKGSDEDERFYAYTAGNIKYMVADGLIKEGLLTKIVRLDDKKVGGKMSSQFQVLQDPDDTLDDASFNAIAPDEGDKKVSASAASVKAATERSAIKAQAQKLTAAMKR